MTRSRAEDGCIGILIVDDHRVFAEVLAMRLRAEPQVRRVDAVTTIGAATALVNTVHPDVVLLDLELDGVSGLDLVAHLDRLPEAPHVIVLSGSSAAASIVAALRLGVEGWVTKDGDLEEVLHAAGDVLEGRLHLPRASLKPVVGMLIEQADAAGPNRTFLDDLTERQVEVLRCLVAGMSRREAAERLYLSTNTVRTHVQNMLQLLGLHSTPALAAAARRAGLRPIDDSG